MFQDFGGDLFMVVTVGFVVLLALGLIYGWMQWARRSPEDDAAAEAGTRRLYEQERQEENARDAGKSIPS